ncbi:hypothetical protein Patl1_12440 [Pistacia atlantica]|uniref:Uncharacterized protein n=1 Tax=Pistacia atlantica TaxID=434234 RepID=A0ACC1AUX0_9ROSI|nr:hypothetical protein Patl1_12440 [Pistacia atlantica]
MEVITEQVNNLNITDSSAANKKNRIQVSNTKKPLFFYVNLAKRYMQQHSEVELSALGMVLIADLLYLHGDQSYFGICVVEWFSSRIYIYVTSTAIATVVTIAEILKNNGLAVEKKIMTSTVDMREETGGRPVQKAKIEILLGKSEKFDELMAAAAEEALENEEQS